MIPNNAARLLFATKCYCSVIILLVVCASARAQFTTTPTDGSTPLGLTPGTPAGSYALSGFETVNPYNGNLNAVLTLLETGGRGGARSVIALGFPGSKPWKIRHQETVDQFGNPADVYTPVFGGGVNVSVGYSPGALIGRQSGGAVVSCNRGRVGAWALTLTRLTFTVPDGTEYELRDQQTGGQPLPVANPCSLVAPTRGTVFVTADGTAATFISDTVISDRVSTNGGGLIMPAGYLMLRDGTKYRIDTGRVTWMRDRNGNKLSCAYNVNGQITTLTDSLNRQVTITYADFQTVFTDQITFKGFGGATRTVQVNYTLLANVLRAGYTLQTYRGLFPEINNASSTTYWNPYRVSSVTLPNNRQYQFLYNSYGELARGVLPTGGAIEYDYTPGSGAISSGGDYEIYRRVVERRVYSDGVSLESRTSYTSTTTHSPSAPPVTSVVIDQLNSAGTLLARSKHYFNGDPGASLFQGGMEYPGWQDGREFETEVFNTDGVTVLRRINNTWQQRAPVSWWTGQPDYAPPNDTRLADTTTTLVDTNQVSKHTFSYDDTVPYNNRSDVYEYDFGAGAPGPLIRRTHTAYVTATNYTDASTGAHIRSLPSQVSIYDAGGIERARATYEYDNYGTDANHAGLVNRAGISGLDSSFSTSYTTRGNATASTHYLLNSSGSIIGSVSDYAQYDIAGNVVKAIDARGNATAIDFSDRFGTADGEATSNSSPSELSSVGQTSYAFATLITNAANHATYLQFDYYLGRPVNAQDANGTVFAGFYNDSLDRPTQVIRDSTTSRQRAKPLSVMTTLIGP